MKQSIGIVGGAGPHAGALLYEKIIQVFQEKYGFHKDADFPHMMLLNIPFSDMLDAPEERRVAAELQEALATLERNGMDYVAIACNTLHAFLPKKMGSYKFVDLRSVVAEVEDEVLILCTSTARERGVYGHLSKGIYLSDEAQKGLDQLIDRILAGKVDREEAASLSKIIRKEGKPFVLLGCTELSLLHARCPLDVPSAGVIDPLQLLAEKLCSL